MSSLMARKDDGSGATPVLFSGAGNSMALAAAPSSSAPCIHAIDESAVQPITWPATSVPNTKAADAEPRTQPYSKPVAAGPRDFEASNASASASEVVGVSAASWQRRTIRNSQNAAIQGRPHARQAARAADAASTWRNLLQAICDARSGRSGEQTYDGAQPQHEPNLLR
jgi:hypothetical protein